jgi:hypothetical protein
LPSAQLASAWEMAGDFVQQLGGGGSSVGAIFRGEVG